MPERMSGNKGEWSELYTFLKLLSQGRVYAADENVNKIEDIYYPILKIIREEYPNEKIEYVVDDKEIHIEVVNTRIMSVSRDEMGEKANELLKQIVAHSNSFEMANLYPLRATDPAELPEEADKKLLEKNIKVIAALEKNYYIDRVWAAWGDTIDKRFYLGDTLYDIAELIHNASWFYRGTLTRSHNPRHPLYMKSGEPFEWFPVSDYAANWRFADMNPWA